MLLATPNGALLLSEPVVDNYPFTPGSHFVMSDLAALPDTVSYYLENGAEREKIAGIAYDKVVHQMPMEKMALELLESIPAV